MRILVAEDDSILADGLLKSLRQSGYAVDWARNGQEADAALAAQPYDLAILDIGMPKMSGLEVLELVKKDPRLKEVPVLILSNLGQDSDIQTGLAMGAMDYLIK
ncbi:MAG TPA: response regulator, partial [Burkholderiales bacterium]|nr:response regulator [Burkholderiales bacterium]